jgi:GNAT superfamily N-acetyltransferase
MGTGGDWRIEVRRGLTGEQARGITRMVEAHGSFDPLRRSVAPEYYLWKLNENPFGQGVVALVLNSEDRVVGSITATCKRAWIDGQPATVCELGDGFTDPAYRKLGFMTRLANRVTEAVTDAGIDFIFGTPNENSRPVLVKGCSFALKQALDLYFWVMPIRPFRLLGEKFPALGFAAALDTPYSGMLAALARSGRRAEERPLAFDEAYDRLNGRLAERYAFLVSKEQDYMRFRYCDNPDASQYGLVESRDDTGALEAALVYKDCRHDGMRVFFIADLFGISRQALAAVWHRAVQIACRGDFDLVPFWGDRTWRTARSMLPLVPLPTASKNLIFFESPRGRQLIEDEREILFRIGDSDNV